MKRLLFTFAASAVLTVTTGAQAQTWLKDRSGSQGTGVRAGDFEIHPGIGVEVGYDSNYFQRSGTDPGLPVVDTARLRVTPSVHISSIGAQRTLGAPPQNVKFTGGVSVAYSEYLMNTGSGSNQGTIGRNRDVGISADATLMILPLHPFGVNITDFFTRADRKSVV